ncbi:MAG: efflux RND transporter periplasmic adaptor subunit [Bacteroidales bacterium]|nr:efflux RND transporter periplasmic adaptor subunit [Bacteroidales bacterium]
MKNIIKIITENLKLFLILLISALIVGFFIGKSTNQHTNQDVHQLESTHQHIDELTNQVWTCSMHPQIKQDKPGLCPICGMDLIPLTSVTSTEDESNPNEIVLSESAAKLASIQTMIVSKGVPKKTLYLQGKVQADERNIALITARFGGRIEKLFVNFTGQQVKKGEKLATIYSPALLTAQKELLEAISFKESRPSIYIASRAKLKLWDLSDDQISAIEEKGEPQVYFDILSPISGTVSMRNVSIGDYMKEGNPLFKVIDLNKVWAIFDAYESDLPWIKTGDKIEFTIQSLPGAEFSSPVTFIDPFINAQTRVTSIRVEVNNSDHKLKPEMFIAGKLNSKIDGGSEQMLIPKSAVLWTGKRSVVYVKVPNRQSPSFRYREIVLGPDAGAFYIVEEGLALGEEIAVNGVFKIDAASQLQGLQSMMNPDGENVSSGSMVGMDMKSESTKASPIEHQMIKVAGNCEMCKDRIEKAAKSVRGVQSAEWSIEKKMLHLSFDKNQTSSDEVQKAIAKVGHDTEKFKANDSVYAKLPACCLYERMNY